VRRGLLAIAALIVCGAIGVEAQVPAHAKGHLGALLGQHAHGQPAAAKSESTPEVLFDATNLGSPVMLDKGWRVGITASQNAANPDFDDSAWALREARETIAEVSDDDRPPEAKEKHPATPDEGPPDLPPGHKRPFAWFRLHVKLAAGHPPMALLVELPVSHNTSVDLGTGGTGQDIDIFANGKLIPPDGPHGDNASHYLPVSRIYNLDIPPSQTSLVVVVRTFANPFGFGGYTHLFATRTFRLGNPDDLGRTLALWSTGTLFERLPRMINSVLLVFLSLFLFALYFTQKGHLEYLWLAFHELVQAPIGFIDMAGATAYLDQLWFGALILQLVFISAYLYFEFLISFLSLRRRWYVIMMRYSAPILAGVAPSLLMIGRYNLAGVFVVVFLLGSFLWLGVWFIFCLATLIKATVRRNFEAGLLLIPLLLTIVGIAEPILTSGMANWAGHPYRSPLTFQAGPIPIHFASIADFTGMLAIVIIIFARFLRIQRDRERASSELAAARNVQELMIPHEKLSTPGFEVDSIYNPATEVGGDFYYVEPAHDGGMLVVIGDVAGKGLKAAMNVSMVMGALRRAPERSPAKILDSLNRVLLGSESFTTCQAAWFGANGELVIANAGHLPPYLNSQEVSLPGGLPLGVLADNSYEEVRMYLHPGDRVLFMSDGVVEARQSSGELFGFDRVHNLSSQSAFYIADAAREFGQEDDITVVAVRRLAQAVAA
jgi:sigma-B regulation protein RsbU (phosphoserine phosphatase)